MNWSFQRNGRSRRAVIGLILFVSLLLALRIWIHAAYGVLIALSLFALPLVWDVLRNPVSGMDITENDLLWYSGRACGAVALKEIAHVRFDTRLDFSVRVTIVLHSGRKVRVIQAATPTPDDLEKTLVRFGVATQHHHFNLMN